MSFKDSEDSTRPTSSSISYYFTNDIIDVIKNELDAAGGNEVLFFGWTNPGHAVERVEVVARGNDGSVAIPIERSSLPDVIIHNHPDGNLTPSDQDVIISSYIANRGVGFYIIDNSVSRVYCVIEAVEKRGIVPLDADALSRLLSEGSPLCAALPHFEQREGQLEMVSYLCDTFNNDALSLIEAGTGIGKTLAYLIPAVRWSLSNNEKVVISTATINLQEQLLYKDIPDLKKTLGSDFTYALMKGRGNYICLNRLYEAQQELFSLIDDEELDQFNAIVDWLQTAEEASLSHLPFVPKSSLWEKINSQTGTCLGGTCSYFSRCPINRVRRDAARAHLIVTNHHYLLADAQMGGSGGALLPPYRRVIFDEAHNLEDSATSFFTKVVKLSSTLKILNRIYSGSRKKRGYLVYLQKKKIFSESNDVAKLMDTTVELRSSAFDLFEKIEEFLALLETQSPNGLGSVIELSDVVRNHPFWNSAVIPSLKRFYMGCSQLANDLLGIRDTLVSAHEERVQRQVEGLISALTEIVEALDRFLGEDDETWVRWIEKKVEVGIVVSMIEVGAILNELIFSRMRSCVLTSATLTVGGSFEFLKSRLSLGSPDIEAQLPSSFDYERQMRIYIPNDISGPGRADYIRGLAHSVLYILKKTRGKAFILFTSYKTLNTVHDHIKDELLEDGFVVFKQGSGSRRRLLDNFKSDIHSVLFGTESFWEGVDAPGETLECVIITKLPFKVPTEPIIRARFEKVRETGGNPFLDYYVPLAVIKLRQGIGRLIRNRNDRGIIVILDPRILVKNYGSLFINSMPTTTVFRGTLTSVLDEVDRFLAITP